MNENMREYMDIEDLHIPIVLQRETRKTLAITVTREGNLLIKSPSAKKDKEIEKQAGELENYKKRILELEQMLTKKEMEK